MSTTLSIPSFSPMIADTPAHLTDAPHSIQWLAIAPDDPHLLDLLSDALAGKPAAIMKVTQGTQDFLNSDVQIAIEQSIRSHAIKHLVLVGISPMDASADETGAAHSESTGSGDVELSYDQLLEGASHQNADNRTDQKSFASAVDQFLESPLVHKRRIDGLMAVCGLFYRACDGVFLLYDPNAKNFKPLATY